jgi:hypothetical protein
MAKIAVTPEFLSHAMFDCSEHPVRIANGRFDMVRDVFIFEIEGDDIPADAAEVIAEFTVLQNRAGDKYRSLRFSTVTKKMA